MNALEILPFLSKVLINHEMYVSVWIELVVCTDWAKKIGFNLFKASVQKFMMK